MARRLRILLLASVGTALGCSLALADNTRELCEPSPARSPWAVVWQVEPDTPAATAVPFRAAFFEAGGLALAASQAASPQAAQPATPIQPRPVAFEYSDAYNTRRKIHFYASFATLPLFVSQYIVGQQLYDGTGDDGTRTAHSALAASTAVLFGVNTVTGVWNLIESRKDPNHRTKRLVHGVLMLAADAGFVATGMLAPEHEEGEHSGDPDTHRAVAITSMAVATTSYLIMLIGR